MTAALDPFKPFSKDLDVIRRLNFSLQRDGCKDGRTGSSTLQHVSLAPLRDDIPLLDPCSGQLSAGAEVDLGIKGRQRFINFQHVASALWVPPGFRERPQTAPNPSGICVDLRQDKAWNSRGISDAALRARLCGSANLHSLQTSAKQVTTDTSLPDKHAGPQDQTSRTDSSQAVRRFIYTSATQRSYEEVGWDIKLPRRLKAPETTLETLADPVSERPSSRRYHSRPQLWQSVGAEWNRRQLRSRNDAKKPVTFCSGYPRSGQIPLYTGTIGSENMDRIDNKDEEFHPLTLKRSIVPAYTPTAHRTTIPGYTGKAAFTNSVLAASCPEGSSGESGRRVFVHVAPLSQMVTTTTPCNPFLRPALPFSHATTQGDVGQRR
ncbi:spermatogenesis-associated protein 48 [Parambassis ranga]|uniref:Spermatogenesis-associated protein 48 n=1 Tax=Parambassis ranga TaxID=210632 RepID=A0A6P7JSG6_9TELE|nr:spermatogenesis-associated protein 48 [Parambassis ranga]